MRKAALMTMHVQGEGVTEQFYVILLVGYFIFLYCSMNKRKEKKRKGVPKAGRLISQTEVPSLGF